jgi:pimeloyl-ACP methyl ester carboxylesterase
MRRWVVVIVCGLVMPAACSSSSSHAGSTQPSSTTAGAAPTTTTRTAPATPDTQVWLCKPGKPGNPCTASLDSTAIGPDGAKTVTKVAPAVDPKIDCFYVYPTVSQQTTPNANLAIDPAEVGVVVAQAARYSQVCHVYAPIYRQVPIAGLATRNAKAGPIAFQSLLSAWKDYLARYNDGRGIVLIGHSQGAFILRQLISKYIEPDASVRARIVSAILLGGNVIVPTGKDVGGDFKYLKACRSASQTGCVIAYSSFDHTPPANSLFGRADKAGEQVLCTNPAALAGGSGPADPYFPTRRMNSVVSFTTQPGVTTAWVNYPDLFTAQCENAGGASWLRITDVRKPGDNRPALADALGPTWGLHIYDANIALGNLVGIVRSEAGAWHSGG